jgi:hypothetical protein
MPAFLLLLLSCARHEDDVSAPPDDADSATEPFVPVAVPLAGCSWYHTAEITVGEQTLHVSVDSGSATMAVSAVGCSTCEDNGVRALYDPSHGTDLHQDASGWYDAGELGWSGDVYRDDVGLAGLPAVRMDFAAVTDVSGMFGMFSCDSDRRVPVDGILGLATDAALLDGTDSYLSELVDDTAAPDAFALHLCHAGGTLWIGGYDDAETTGPMEYASLGSSYLYTVDVASFEIEAQDGTTTVAPVAEGDDVLPALLDSGGPNLIVPSIAYDRVTETIAADPAFSVFAGSDWWGGAYVTSAVSPTELAASLPRLLVDLADGVQLSLPATESYVRWYDLQDGTYVYWTTLYSGAELGGSWNSFIDLGNLPMTSYAVLVDRDEGRMGFAPAVECP